VNLAVVGDQAHLDVHTVTDGGPLSVEPVFSVQVPARSLLLALQAGIDDNQDRVEPLGADRRSKPEDRAAGAQPPASL
jgi:hypothetical protein